ncbi:MAG: hypothetical protein U9N49_03040 [Campylobacterota bacterium]|nr:hypothetical protein [Campylobacterota bacterium]
MISRIKAFLKEAGVEISSQLIEKIRAFLASPNTNITFNRGQLYFVSLGSVVEAVACRGNSWQIYEFDGREIRRIDSSYYLGEDMERSRVSASVEFESDGGSSNNNNNNNNGNNGNNNG